GGTITARGAYHGAGIGGGYYDSRKSALSPSVVNPNTGSGYSGSEWLSGVNEYIKSNYELLETWVNKYNKIKLMKMESSYLAWMDI
ncbi:hypothetical protein ACTPEF_23750, partial [Clostridioides difficile]